MKRIFRTAYGRDTERNVTTIRGAQIIVLEYDDKQRLVTTAPGREEMVESSIVSPEILNPDELVRVEVSPTEDDVFRILTVSISRIGRNAYGLTRKLDNAA